jgi:hypothetical protein
VSDDLVTEKFLEVRERWLYAWLKDRDPDTAARLLESLVIIHDDLDGSLLYAYWMAGGGGTEARVREFAEGKPTETFRRVNEAHRHPLKLVAQKLDGCRADFYGPG